jgi:hypothetical protein
VTPRSLSLLALAAALSCHPTAYGGPVPVEGSQEEISAIAGEWSGEYRSKDAGRHGVIRFVMPERADTGFGEVEITFSPALAAAAAAPDADPKAHTGEDLLDPDPCPFLSIKVVRIEKDAVRGTLVPYWDPDCECRTQTVFEGKVSGNRIEGTFSSRRQSAERPVFSGQWRVERGRS